MSEVTITICRENKDVAGLSAPVGALFLQLLKGNGYPLVCCNGTGGCGRCRIRFPDRDAPLPTAADRRALTAEQLREGIRLACAHRVKRGCRIEPLFVQPSPVRVVTCFGEETGTEARIREKEAQAEKYLLAIDLGTTTIAMRAVEWESLKQWREKGSLRVLAEYSVMNPQREWGADIISRIRAAQSGQESALRETVRTALREGIALIRKETGREPQRTCLAGNTTMEHLLAGLDTSGLGKFPFTPVSLQEQRWEEVCLLPGISAFVGADILAGLLACGFYKKGGCRLFVDLGTNGEMAAGDGDRLICTATAAGPAFEGGAGVNVPGTDMVALLAEMLEKGIVDDTGLLREDLFENGWQKGELRITRQDIRALQMAKAAVRAGVEILLSRMGTDCAGVDEVFLAGGFGYYLDVESAVKTGLFPEGLSGKIKAVGNTALLGAALYGGTPGMAAEAERLARKAQVINLAEEPDFERLYVENMNL